MICFHTKFHMPSSDGSLVIAIKPKTKFRLRAAAMLLLYILQHRYLTKDVYFRSSIITHHFSARN